MLLVNITAEVTKREAGCRGWGHPKQKWSIMSCFVGLLPD